MREFRYLWFIILICSPWLRSIASSDFPEVVVDGHGVMRRADNGQEVSYLGVNYTVPFAHAYRALGYLGVDRKQAIDRDVYHMARLGLNAFRIHLWDVELSDESGHLLDNDHLDLLDYLIFKLEKRGISTVVTAQTNFGNGYPEPDCDTGAFGYRYGKCDIHSDSVAIDAQKRYLGELVSHVNRYTGLAYADDPAIIALEINNEPCHTGSASQVRDYINQMVMSARQSGWHKMILYNVTHNTYVVDAYYKADIQGTTYQWYPTGLVSGHEIKGNLLPWVDDYTIPFDTITGFDSKARLIYEFDPADVMCSYLYPAVVRTLRGRGFQWITQFSYDPVDMAWCNSEYPTHFLNLAYTPRKALGLMIAAEVSRNMPLNHTYGKYPDDIAFGPFSVDYGRDLAVMNASTRFIYTNDTDVMPACVDSLEAIAGCGTSSVVAYSGTGAYFLDKVYDGVWRLEVMPDVVISTDPFDAPSLKHQVGETVCRYNEMKIYLPDLTSGYFYKGINAGNHCRGQAMDSGFPVYPGVYLLFDDETALAGYVDDGGLSEYVAPENENVSDVVLNHSPEYAVQGDSVRIAVQYFGVNVPDSVKIYVGDVSMWRSDNEVYAMDECPGYNYETKVKIPSSTEQFRYRIVVFGKGGPVTFPGNVTGTPVDWDFLSKEMYIIKGIKVEDPITLISSETELTLYTIPDSRGLFRMDKVSHIPVSLDELTFDISPQEHDMTCLAQCYVRPVVSGCQSLLTDSSRLYVSLSNCDNVDTVEVAVIDNRGLTFSKCIPSVCFDEGTTFEVRADEMSLRSTLLVPAAFPSFLSREFVPDLQCGFKGWDTVETVQLIFHKSHIEKNGHCSLTGIWLMP